MENICEYIPSNYCSDECDWLNYDLATSNMKWIEFLSKQIVDLFNKNEKLNDCIKRYNEYINFELKNALDKIDKMKCCENCSSYSGRQTLEYPKCILLTSNKDFYMYRDCIRNNYKYWRLKEEYIND